MCPVSKQLICVYEKLFIFLRSFPKIKQIVVGITELGKLFEENGTRMDLTCLASALKVPEIEEVISSVKNSCIENGVYEIYEIDRNLLTFVCLKATSLINKSDTQNYDYADAFHGLGGAVISGRLKRKEYFETYIKPYIEKYPDHFRINDLERLNKWCET